MSDVTGDTRVVARSAMGYDWNYLADDESLIFGSDSDASFGSHDEPLWKQVSY